MKNKGPRVNTEFRSEILRRYSDIFKSDARLNNDESVKLSIELISQYLSLEAVEKGSLVKKFKASKGKKKPESVSLLEEFQTQVRFTGQKNDKVLKSSVAYVHEEAKLVVSFAGENIKNGDLSVIDEETVDEVVKACQEKITAGEDLLWMSNMV